MAVKKVGGGKAEKDAEKEALKEAKRPQAFASVEGGHKQAMPVGFDFSKHKPILKKGEFANDVLRLEHMASFFDYRANKLKLRADKLRERAKVEAKFGDPKQRKMVKKAIKATEQLAETAAALKAAGIDIEALLAQAKADAQKAAAEQPK